MKKMIALMAAATLLLCFAGSSMAKHVYGPNNTDFKTYGMFIVGGSAVNNADFADEGDNSVIMDQRLRQFFEYVANENLKATVGYEFNNVWGSEDAPAGADATGQLSLKRANVEFTWPGTELSTKAGIQWINLPSVGLGSNPVLAGDMGGIVMSAPITDAVDLTFGYTRPYNNPDTEFDAEQHPGVDSFFAAMPISQDGFSMAPFVDYTMIGDFGITGEDTEVTGYTPNQGVGSASFVEDSVYAPRTAYMGLLGSYGLDSDFIGPNAGDARVAALSDDANAYWVGTNYSLTMMDPLSIKGSVIYGSVNTDSDDEFTGRFYNNAGNVVDTFDVDLERSGWYADLNMDYDMGMMTPSVWGHYASGSDDDLSDGSEAFPMIYNDGLTSNLNSMIMGDRTELGIIGTGNSLMQGTPVGLWSIGAGLKDIAVTDKLSSTVIAAYYQGTNEDVDLNVTGTPYSKQDIQNLVNAPGTSLSEEGSAWEITLHSEYKIYENLSALMNAGYAAVDKEHVDDSDEDGASMVEAGVRYNF